MLKGATPTQYHEREGLAELLATDLVKDRSVAIDGGAHVGTWTELMAASFDRVHAFEPSPAFLALAENSHGWKNVVCHRAALMDEECWVESYHRKKIGKLTSRRVRKVSHCDLDGVTIDSLALDRCGLIKLDIEGAEYLALIGSRATVARCRPFLLVEMAGHGGHLGYSDAEVRALILSMGYRQVWEFHVDVGFAPIEERI